MDPCSSINDKFLKALEWHYHKKAKINTNPQKLEILQPNNMDNDMMQCAFRYINVYLTFITEVKINGLVTIINMGIMDRDLFEFYQNRIEQITKEFLQLISGWAALMSRYWITNKPITLSAIKRTLSVTEIASELVQIKMFLQIATGNRNWRRSVTRHHCYYHT